MLIGEYVCNLFFKELEKMPLSFVADQSKTQIENLKKLSEIYSITIIAPIITIDGQKAYKSIYKFTNAKATRSDQQVLIDYTHWNEERFFANPVAPFDTPFMFSHNGFKIACMMGYELHFDQIWQKVIEKSVDIVLLPTASTFESFARWQTLIKARAFNASCFVVRANRLGEYEEKGNMWEFYGNSLICNPFGEIEDALDDQEGLLIANIEKATIAEAKKAFGFARAIKKRSSL